MPTNASTVPPEAGEPAPLPEDFDEAVYLAQNADVRRAVERGAIASGAEHYLRFGSREGRPPGMRPSPETAPKIGPDGTPYPPADMMFLVTHGRDPAVFEATGLADLRSVLEAVGAGGLALPEKGLRVLDWGCGCGRLARHWPALAPHAVLHGCDINEDLVGWCRDNLRSGTFAASPFDPPLAYPDGSFDLIYGISVLTHLTFEEHHRWMREIWRLLAPGGAAIVTAHGPTMLPGILMAVRHAGPDSTQILRTTLIDEDVFACVEDAGGSNASGNVLTGAVFEKIFWPFEVRVHRPRFGLMGIHDTYCIAKKPAASLTAWDDLASFQLDGLRCERSLSLALDGETRFGTLVRASNLYFPASVRIGLRIPGGPELGGTPVALPDKIAWTQIDAAYAFVAIEGIPAHRGDATLTIAVESGRPNDGGQPHPLDGVSLTLAKATLF